MWNSFFVLSFRLSKSSVLFCTAPATFLNQKFRGQTVVRLLLITCPWGGAEKIKGHQLTVELVCVWMSQASMLFRVILKLNFSQPKQSDNC